MDRPPRWSKGDDDVNLCAWHWGALAIEAAAGSRRDLGDWRAGLENALTGNQRDDGSWPTSDAWSQAGGSVFATATATLALLAPQAYGPDWFSGNWRKRHQGACQALAGALQSTDPRVRRAAIPYADLVE
jgi:hypothetical protein